MERERKGVPCENPLLLEIQQFYRKEYALAGRALQIVKEYMGIQMSEEEQGFITLHIVNATMPQRSDRLIISVQLVRDVLAIVSERLTPRPGRSMATRCSVSMKRRIRGRSRVRSQLPTT